MVVYEWNDSIEKTLDIMRQNSAKLGELSLENYNAFKKRIHYLQLPLAILSAANAYAVVDLDHYVSENYVTIACCVVSATLAGYLTYDWYVDSQKQMEKDFSFHTHCLEFTKEIKDVLVLARYDRTIDGDLFLRDKFKQYKELVSGNTLIEKFKGDLTLLKDSLCEKSEHMDEFVMDHWNIIFRPTLRRFKKKNMELIACVKQGGQSLNDIIEPVSAQENKFKWINEKWNDLLKGGKKDDTKKEEDIESPVEESKSAEGVTEKEKALDFSDVYTVKEIPSLTFSKKEESKKFHVAFVEQI